MTKEMTKEVLIDGSTGEGGGQMLRTALNLSVISGRPLQMIHVRANRSRPGLRPQHLRGLQELSKMSCADVDGDEPNSMEILFQPQAQPAGDRTIEIGTAGSTALLLHTLYLPLALHQPGGTLRLGGGTHVTGAPTFDYLQEVWSPLLRHCGLQIDLSLERYGLYPKGKGKIRALVPGGQQPQAIEWLERPPLEQLQIIAIAPALRPDIPRRMAESASELLRGFAVPLEVDCSTPRSASPGAICHVFCRLGSIRAGFTVFGRKGMPAEKVGAEAARLAMAYLDSEGVVDERAADQLMLPLALASQPSAYTTTRLTNHIQTNAQVIQSFLPHLDISFAEQAPGRVLIQINPAPPS